jgi:hypothetical protein
MGRYNEMDLAITLDGDLIVDEEKGDFATVENSEAAAQNMFCRLKSSDPEWFDETLAANLEDLLGLPNTRENGEKGEEMIRHAMLIDDLISIDDLYVQAVPIDKYTLVFFVFFQGPETDKPIGYEVEVNLSSGATVRRVE